MAISASDDFSDAGLEDFQQMKLWDLCAGNSGRTDSSVCANGEYAVYVKFYTV